MLGLQICQVFKSGINILSNHFCAGKAIAVVVQCINILYYVNCTYFKGLTLFLLMLDIEMLLFSNVKIVPSRKVVKQWKKRRDINLNADVTGCISFSTSSVRM